MATIAWDLGPGPTLSTKVRGRHMWDSIADKSATKMSDYVDMYEAESSIDAERYLRQQGMSDYDQQISAMHELALKKPRWDIQPSTCTTQASGSALTISNLTAAVESLEANQLRNAKNREINHLADAHRYGLMSYQEYAERCMNVHRKYETQGYKSGLVKCAYCLKEFDDTHYNGTCPKKKEETFSRKLHLLFFRRYKK